MLTKPLSHLRPLLRLPSHSSPGPEHFSSNPSLLHHLPHNPTASLVSASQSSAQAAGAGSSSGPSGAGSGRAGWGAGAGGNGGYTGHARAFLALQQNAALDPTSGIAHSNDEKQRKNNSLFFKHRMGRSVQIVQVENETVGRQVHRSIEARSGSRVGIVDLEGKPAEEVKLLESESRTSSRRRSSITFPTPSVAPHIASPIPSRSVTPRQSLSRSQSSTDLWHVGVSRPRDVHIRQLSTKSANVPLPLVEEAESPIVSAAPPLSTRILGQPNRVLMDLAGIDLPGRPARTPLVRRNSTAAIRQSEPELDTTTGADTDAENAAPAKPEMSEDDIKERRIYDAIARARMDRKPNLLTTLVNHYRSARTVDAFSIASRNDSLLAEYPLPPRYTTACYNACIEGYLVILRQGESIAPILEMYNEMIDRDCLPNGRTYSNLIRALCFRERDVALARRDWEREKKMARWRAQQLGLEYDAAAEEEQDQMFEAYAQEGNLVSALKLFETAIVTRQHDEYRLRPPAYRALLKTAARVPLNKDQVRSVFNVVKHANATRSNANRALRADLFLVYARNGQTDNLRHEWQMFKDHDCEAKYRHFVDWLEEFSRTDDAANEVEVMKARSAAWLTAAEAFLVAGDISTAKEIFADLEKAAKDRSTKPRDHPGPPSYLSIEAVGDFGHTLIQQDYNEGIQFFLDRNYKPAVWARYHRSTLQFVLDAVLQHGSLDHVRSTIADNDFWARLNLAQRGEVYIAIARAFGTEQDAAAWDVFSSVADKTRVNFDLDVCRFIFQSMLHSERCSTHLWNALTPFKWEAGRPVDAETQQYLLDMIKATLREVDLTLHCQLELVRHAEQFTNVADEEISTILAKAYLDHGALEFKDLATAEPYEPLIKALLVVSEDDPEYDDALVRVAEDLAGVVRRSSMALMRRAEGPIMKDFAARLVHRLGQERAAELLNPAFGEAWVSKWARLSAPAPASPEFADESVPARIPPAPPSTVDIGIGEKPLQISSQLSSYVGRVNRPHHQHPIAMRDALKAIRVELDSSGTVPHPTQLAYLIDILGRENSELEARRLYSLAQHVIRTTVPEPEKRADWLTIENYMLIACCHLGHLEEAGMHRARILNAGMVPSADAYATMIACSKDTTDDALVARELFDEARTLGVEPNLFLYNTIISKLSKARKAEMALDLFKTMKASGLRPSSVTYGAVINACCRVGDGESAATLFQEMSSRPDFRPRVPPYNTMMQFHLTTQPSRERVLYYYNELRNRNVPLSAHTYKLLLDAYGALPEINLPAMEKVFDDLVWDRKVQVQGTHWASLITAYGIHGNNLNKAMETFRSIPSQGKAAVNVAAEPVIWEAVIGVLTHHNQIEEMERVMNQMFESKVKATAYVYNNLILGYARAGHLDKARGIFSSMGDSITGVAAPNNHPQLLTSSGHLKPSTVTNVPTGVVYREPSTYETMIRAELSGGNLEAAEQVLKKMEERRYPFAVFMRAKALLDDYTVVQSAASSKGHLEAAMITPTYGAQPLAVTPPTEAAYHPSSPVKGDVLDNLLSAEEKAKFQAEKEKAASETTTVASGAVSEDESRSALSEGTGSTVSSG